MTYEIARAYPPNKMNTMITSKRWLTTSVREVNIKLIIKTFWSLYNFETIFSIFSKWCIINIKKMWTSMNIKNKDAEILNPFVDFNSIKFLAKVLYSITINYKVKWLMSIFKNFLLEMNKMPSLSQTKRHSWKNWGIILIYLLKKNFITSIILIWFWIKFHT